jgi:N-acetyl-gamma-glutamyl-phosphate reductase
MSKRTAVRVAVVGATGYAGAELVRLLAVHPVAKLTLVTSERDAGKAIGSVHRTLGFTGLTLESVDVEVIAGRADLAFVALPHGTSAGVVAALLERGLRVVDLGADFRFQDRSLYEQWYGRHEAPALLEEAVYGLTEHYRDAVADARLVANPGCYPTGALMPTIPLADQIRSTIFVDSKSGTSGAGRKADQSQLFAEVSENIRPYKVWSHRHQPEIESRLAAAGGSVQVRFTPHLLPIARGLLTACYVELAEGAHPGDALHTAYENEPFVRLLGEGQVPEPRNVRGTNMVEIGCVHDKSTGSAVLFSAIDNLGKGAAGQAVQNLNCMLGLDETAGLGSLIPALP